MLVVMEGLEENYNTVRRRPLALQLLETKDNKHNLILSYPEYSFGTHLRYIQAATEIHKFSPCIKFLFWFTLIWLGILYLRLYTFDETIFRYNSVIYT
jgi:hypothetical protein